MDGHHAKYRAKLRLEHINNKIWWKVLYLLWLVVVTWTWLSMLTEFWPLENKLYRENIGIGILVWPPACLWLAECRDGSGCLGKCTLIWFGDERWCKFKQPNQQTNQKQCWKFDFIPANEWSTQIYLKGFAGQLWLKLCQKNCCTWKRCKAPDRTLYSNFILIFCSPHLKTWWGQIIRNTSEYNAVWRF